jgi:ppGpp synthetase/RelA/SpoT-type nucleotidyltranferase
LPQIEEALVALLPRATLEFHASYTADFDRFQQAAGEAEAFVRRCLAGEVEGILSIHSRAKHPLSLLDKLRRKEYTTPKEEVKDLVGVRVVTAYPDQAEQAALRLRDALTVDEEASFDRLYELDESEFGYRSIHLVVQLAERDRGMGAEAIDALWFEIQLRSVLQHAWALLDHEAVYKSGVTLPRELKRQFSALAGALEVADQVFLRLRSEQSLLVDQYVDRYRQAEDEDVELDALRLTALLKAVAPDGEALEDLQAVALGPSARLSKLLVEALAETGIRTGKAMRLAMEERDVSTALRRHASAVGVAVEQLSHAVLTLIVIWLESPDVLNKQFPELRFDADLARTLGFEVSPLLSP